jgi:hypothetical protein
LPAIPSPAQKRNTTLPNPLLDIMSNPLMARTREHSFRPEGFLRLVLATAANYGMPPQVIASLDDLGSILGYHEPLSASQAGHLAAPLAAWRTDRRQPVFEQNVDVAHLAYMQRCLIAFGGAQPGHMVGTAEIVFAMGNVHQDFLEKELGVSGTYREIFNWAAIDVLSALEGKPKDHYWTERKWAVVTDDDVIKPSGRLYATYVEMATYIRRMTNNWLKDRPDHPRKLMEPVAKTLLDSWRLVRQRLAERALSNENLQTVLPSVDEAIQIVEHM